MKRIKLVEQDKYRKDVDGLRALAIIAVILFHFGQLPNGFLGVDIFFVISGYLITKLIYLASIVNKFSIVDFYLRRVRRILPLVSFFCLLSLIIGSLVMLPSDLENLTQTVVATNLFANNVLQYLTFGNYWAVVNEFKPLITTWSLGIEEQYYFLYPFIFLLFKGQRLKFILPILIVLTIGSLVLYFSPFSKAAKFYLLPFRFFELAIGGLGAIVLKNQLLSSKYRLLFLAAVLFVLVFEIPFLPKYLLIPLIVFLTIVLLLSSSASTSSASFVLENKLMVGIGRISFSMYLWHQMLLSFTRYFILQELSSITLMIIFVLTILLSIITYFLIEQPFRVKDKIPTSSVLLILGITNILTTGFALLLYFNAGVIRNVSELNIDKQHVTRNMHLHYNSRIDKMNANFKNDGRKKIFVLGNSFGRDWVNVLLESKFSNQLDIAFVHETQIRQKLSENIKNKIKEADLIFWSTLQKNKLEQFHLTAKEKEKIWCIGTKNFGTNLGIFYNYRGDNYCEQKTKMDKGYLPFNNKLKEQWNTKFIDLIGLISDEQNRISQDCIHLTKAGAQYFASLLEQQPDFILNKHFK